MVISVGKKNSPFNSDLEDTPDSLALFPTIASLIRLINYTIGSEFNIHDQNAIRDQKYHNYFAHIAVLSGTIAIIFAILQLTGFLPKQLSLPGETAATLISLIAVVSGTIWAFQKKWLLERYKAESLRLLKFRALLQPDFLCGNSEPLRQWMTKEIVRIQKLEGEALHHITKCDGNIPALSSEIPDCDPRIILEVAGYYKAKRIANQIQYFHRRAEERDSVDRYTRNLPHIFFFLGVVAVALHFIIGDFVEENEWYFIANFLVFFGIATPILGIGIRTYRSTHEFARSVLIFKAKEMRLAGIDRNIERQLNEKPFDSIAILSLLEACEDLLEEEHHEWLRLMVESEWFV